MLIPQQQMNNAQQQQFYNYQQNSNVVPQMNSNSLMNNAQMQMNMNQAPQMSNMMPRVQQIAPNRNIGMWGNTRQEHMDVEWPSVFNDDEPFVESVK